MFNCSGTFILKGKTIGLALCPGCLNKTHFFLLNLD